MRIRPIIKVKIGVSYNGMDYRSNREQRSIIMVTVQTGIDWSNHDADDDGAD